MSKTPYTFPHKSRAAKVDYLTGIGGYGDHWNHWPIEFTVATYYADLSFDNLVKRVREEYLDPKEFADGTRALALFTDAMRRVYGEHGSHIYTWAVDDAARSVNDSDCYRMLWDGTKTLDVKWSFAGRQGKHLVLERFEGFDFAGMRDREFEDMLRAQRNPNGYELEEHYAKLKKDHSWVIPTDTLDTLYRFIRQCEIDFTPIKASREVEHSAAFHLHAMAEETYTALYGTDTRATDAVLTAAAKEVLGAIHGLDTVRLGAFRRLCSAAGIDVAGMVLEGSDTTVEDATESN